MTERNIASDKVSKQIRRGWFADVDREQITEYVWQPCFETGHGHVPCFEVWFKTEAECEQWIAENVIGAGWLPGEPTSLQGVESSCVTCSGRGVWMDEECHDCDGTGSVQGGEVS